MSLVSRKQRKSGSQSCAHCPVLPRAAACPRLVAVTELSSSEINGKHSSRKIYSNTLHGARNNKKPIMFQEWLSSFPLWFLVLNDWYPICTQLKFLLRSLYDPHIVRYYCKWINLPKLNARYNHLNWQIEVHKEILSI